MAKRKLPKIVTDAFRALGREGGLTRKKRLSPARRKEIARQASRARWDKATKKRGM